MSYMGIDVGTSGVKVAAFTPEGKMIAAAAEKYELIYGKDGSVSLNPKLVWEAIKSSISEVAYQTRTDPVRALAVSALGEAVTPVDAEGNFLGNTLVAFDTRATEEVHYLKNEIGVESIFNKTGHNAHPMYSIHKIALWKKNQRDVYKKAYKFLCWQDMVAFQLGVGAVIDFSQASRTQAFHVKDLQWDADILSTYEIDMEKLPEARQAGSYIGKVSPQAAAELGLPPGTIVVTGGFDQACAALGAGVNRSDKAAFGLGTVACLTVTMDEPLLNEVMQKSNFPCIPYLLPGMYCSIAYNFSGGSLIQWFVRSFAQQEACTASKEQKNVLDLLFEEMSETAGGIFVLPHFMGSGTPYMDPDAKGAVLGLNLNSSKSQLFRAVVEGIAFEMRLNMSLLKEAGINIKKLIASGGGTQSDKVLQINADILEKPINTTTVETGCLGCAILAAVSLGEFKSYDEAVDHLIDITDTYEPNDRNKVYYTDSYKKYLKIYDAVKTVN